MPVTLCCCAVRRRRVLSESGALKYHTKYRTKYFVYHHSSKFVFFPCFLLTFGRGKRTQTQQIAIELAPQHALIIEQWSFADTRQRTDDQQGEGVVVSSCPTFFTCMYVSDHISYVMSNKILRVLQRVVEAAHTFSQHP